ncbi:MAG: TetR/AcrR family transcriptional regulator [Lachnospiraceae bacterium]|nr:TetR/AcrR family transcriptional regulator [Lachnospiraceae bacterium]
MPQIFDEAGREKVRCQLLESGFQLIKLYGLKKTSVSDIAKEAGIATGTFYNFFKTKEEFVYQITLYKRNGIKEKLSALMTNGKLSKEDFRKYLEEIYLADNNIFEYLDDREIAVLKARWPEEYWKNSRNDEATTKWILEHLDTPNPTCSWKLLANLCKSIALIGSGKDTLYQEEYKETIQIIIDSIIEHAFL